MVSLAQFCCKINAYRLKFVIALKVPGSLNFSGRDFKIYHARFRKSAQAYKCCDALRNVTSSNTKLSCAGIKRMGKGVKDSEK